MNIYRQRFTSTCCNNGITVIYDLEIAVQDSVIMVEDIQAACLEAATLPKPYH
jgi:hypothetical protein